jgi:hypothetical protein
LTIRKCIDIKENNVSSATTARGGNMETDVSYAALVDALDKLPAKKRLEIYSDFIDAKSAKNASRSGSDVDSHKDFSDTDS